MDISSLTSLGTGLSPEVLLPFLHHVMTIGHPPGPSGASSQDKTPKPAGSMESKSWDR